MTNGNKHGTGTRFERHDPEVVAKTIEAKERLATDAEEVVVIDRMTAVRLNVDAAYVEMRAARDRLHEAENRHSDAVLKWAKALLALEAEEQANG